MTTFLVDNFENVTGTVEDLFNRTPFTGKSVNYTRTCSVQQSKYSISVQLCNWINEIVFINLCHIPIAIVYYYITNFPIQISLYYMYMYMYALCKPTISKLDAQPIFKNKMAAGWIFTCYVHMLCYFIKISDIQFITKFYLQKYFV